MLKLLSTIMMFREFSDHTLSVCPVVKPWIHNTIGVGGTSGDNGQYVSKFNTASGYILAATSRMVNCRFFCYACKHTDCNPHEISGPVTMHTICCWCKLAHVHQPKSLYYRDEVWRCAPAGKLQGLERYRNRYGVYTDQGVPILRFSRKVADGVQQDKRCYIDIDLAWMLFAPYDEELQAGCVGPLWHADCDSTRIVYGRRDGHLFDDVDCDPSVTAAVHLLEDVTILVDSCANADPAKVTGKRIYVGFTSFVQYKQVHELNEQDDME